MNVIIAGSLFRFCCKATNGVVIESIQTQIDNFHDQTDPTNDNCEYYGDIQVSFSRGFLVYHPVLMLGVVETSIGADCYKSHWLFKK